MVLRNTGLCALHTVRPNKPPCWSLEQRKVCCRVMKGKWVVPAKKKSQTPQRISIKLFKGQGHEGRGSQVAQWWRIRPPMQETRILSLGSEEPLEEEIATHSSILTWRIPWTEEPGGLQSVGHKESDTTEWLSMHEGEGSQDVWSACAPFSDLLMVR